MPALDLPATETAIVEATNAFRAKHNLSALRPNAQLAAAARAYAKSLAARGDLTHTANGTTPSSRAQAAGYSYCLIAENLALIYDSRGFTPRSYAKRAQDGWEASPGHRENLMRPGVTETGVGVSGSKPNDPRYVAVQLLGRPAALKFSFALKNTSERPVELCVWRQAPPRPPARDRPLHHLLARAARDHDRCPRRRGCALRAQKRAGLHLEGARWRRRQRGHRHRIAPRLIGEITAQPRRRARRARGSGCAPRASWHRAA